MSEVQKSMMYIALSLQYGEIRTDADHRNRSDLSSEGVGASQPRV